MTFKWKFCLIIRLILLCASSHKRSPAPPAVHCYCSPALCDETTAALPVVSRCSAAMFILDIYRKYQEHIKWTDQERFNNFLHLLHLNYCPFNVEDFSPHYPNSWQQHTVCWRLLGLLFFSLQNLRGARATIRPDQSLITSVWMQLVIEWLTVINEGGCTVWSTWKRCTWRPACGGQLLHCVRVRSVHTRESRGLGCSNYHVPSGRDVKRLSIDLYAPGDSPKPNEVWRRGEWLVRSSIQLK